MTWLIYKHDLKIDNCSASFSYSIHICNIVKKARNKLSWCLSVFKSRSQITILTLFTSLIRPIVEYCSVVWDPSKITDISLLESIQRSATAKISSLAHLNYWERLKELKLFSLQRRRERYTIMYMHKILNHVVPNDIGVIFYFSPRLGMKAKLPPLPSVRNRLSTYDSSFSYRGPLLWNVLPSDLNTITSFSCFKAALDKFILNYPDHPPVTGYTTVNNNSLVNWV